MKLITVIKTSFLCCLITSIGTIQAQSNSSKGDKYFDQNLFESAIKYYQLDAKSRSRKVSEYALQRLADCYRITGEFEKAEETYKKILKKKKKDPVNFLNYGLSLKSSAKYAEAMLQFQEYITLKPDDPMGKVYLLSCDSAQLWLDETIGKEVKNLTSINTEQSDFSPVFGQQDVVYFTSSREGSKTALISFDGGAEVHRLDLYQIPLDKIETKEILKSDITNLKEINTPLHEGSACFSSDGKEIYFTKTVKGSKDKSTNSILSTLQIYYSYKDSSGKWSKPKSAFKFNSLNYSVGQPSISKDGTTLFFMSDMPGGFGKTDIYYTSRQTDGSWGKPVNVGPDINTFGYELFPCISHSGDLYFSSNAHPGMGQLDIFKCSNLNNKWTNVHNLKPPINSIANDFGITFDGNHLRGFFSSDRFNGKGAEDIYSFSEETCQELSLNNDSLFFRDLSVFDDIKYKLTNETDSTDIELSAQRGLFSVPLIKDKTYKLSSSKYGMKYNQVRISFTRNAQDTSMSVIISSSEKDLFIAGRNYVGPKHTELADIPSNSTNFSPEGNTSFSELQVSLDKAGYFTFKAFIAAGKQNTLGSNDVIKGPPQKN